jgi:mannitol-1-phosphate 5-dehydrogenase
MGYLSGYELVYQAVENPAVRSRVTAILRETAEALHKQYGQDLDTLMAHAEELLDRFGNRALRDTVERVARDPVRKLGPNERFMRAAACCLAHGIQPHGLAFAAAAAIRYDLASDPTAATVQALLHEEGWDAVLERVCGLPPGSPFARLIKESGLAMAAKNTSKS